MKTARIALGVGALALTEPVHGQDLIAWSRSETRVLAAACSQAELDCWMTTGFDLFMDQFTSQDWSLVVIERYTPLDTERKERLLPALAEHLDRGGRLLLAYTNLDEWPELQELVGVRTTGDVTWVGERRIWSVDPPHPVWPHSAGAPIIGDMKYWEDNGDFLDPGASGSVLATWDVPGGQPAMTLTRTGRVLTNGFDFDAFDGFVNKIIEEQLRWMLSCQADVDGDGELTFFDFLAFQTLFAAGDPAADFSFDGQLDFFDFLEFQNQFAIGCP